jgi:trk system potassium uptake protein TrkA
VLVGLIRRDQTYEIPHGGSSIKRDDEVTLIGRRENIGQAVKLFHGVELRNEKVVIMGGSRTGLHLAEMLENRGKRVKLFDWNLGRCNELAAQLKTTKVVCRDATSRLALEQEHVDGADIVVSVTHDDERNILASVLAKEVGARQALAVVHQPDFASLVTKLGIDHAVTPRACIANRIMRLVTSRQSRALAVIGDGQAEVIEFKVGESSPLDGRELRDLEFPAGALVASILRKESVIVPRGDDVIRAGDAVIVVALADSRDDLDSFFET